jgi:hypothetical protein
MGESSMPAIAKKFEIDGPELQSSVVSGLLPDLMERAMGIEPTSEAWEASILPLYDARSGPYANKPPRRLQEFFLHNSC